MADREDFLMWMEQQKREVDQAVDQLTTEQLETALTVVCLLGRVELHHKGFEESDKWVAVSWAIEQRLLPKRLREESNRAE